MTSYVCTSEEMEAAVGVYVDKFYAGDPFLFILVVVLIIGGAAIIAKAVVIDIGLMRIVKPVSKRI